MSKKTNWAVVDKRIRARRTSWTGEELKALEAGLQKLPDGASALETIDVPQPALSSGFRSASERDDGAAN